MYTCKHLGKWLIGLMLAVILSACQAAPTAGPGVASPTTASTQAQFSDPFAYCEAVGDIDVPDARYIGTAVPDEIVQDLRKKAGIATDVPSEWVTAGTVWRCMDRQVWACFVGANLPCSEKADVSSTPQPTLNDFCKSNPQADAIPASVTGRATIYDWRCSDGAPQVVRQLVTPDARGFPADFWYPIVRPFQ